MNKEAILQKVCEKAGKDYHTYNINFDIEECLRGFLLSPEVMKAVWGEEEVDVYGKDWEKIDATMNGLIDATNADEINYTGKVWQYHAQQLVLLTTDEIIEYYGRYV